MLLQAGWPCLQSAVACTATVMDANLFLSGCNQACKGVGPGLAWPWKVGTRCFACVFDGLLRAPGGRGLCLYVFACLAAGLALPTCLFYEFTMSMDLLLV
ncbi:unnamed protein product [Polarella glacialis]|uniref:Uncharacterized protein n=1 Tax=Polarella glacialis TaxID=89957 RepID=A0A813IM55_POLGL|nr:unnamed protein product [Polarella glacialis]